MPRTLSANLTAAMDLKLFSPYIRIHIGSGLSGDLAYSVQPIAYRLEATRASFVCQPPTTTFANMTKFYIERGAMINGVPDTIETSYFWISKILFDGLLIHVEGSLFLERSIYTAGIDYNSALVEFGETSSIEITTASYEGTPAWKTYTFLPTSRALNNPEYALSLIKQKYLLFLLENGHTDLGEHFSQVKVFCATDTRSQDYTITDQLFKYVSGLAKRSYIWRDEAGTIHTEAHPSGITIIPIHNLGYLESTDDPPNNIDSPKSGSKAIVPIHLKYQRGDYVTINSGTSGDIHEYTGRIDVVEVLDTNHEPAWYNEIIPLVHFENTEGGALPSTIERVAAYTPLVTINFNGNLDETVNNLQALAERVDDHDHGNLAKAIQAPTATNDFLVGTQISTIWTWTKKTLAETITILRTSLDSIYASITDVIPKDGWIAGTDTWSYSSADSPSFVISINADMTTLIGAGDRIKLTQTTAKYFIVTAVGTFSGGATLITVYGGTDYTLANAAISNPFYSHVKHPFGFPLDRAKWTASVTDTTNRTQATPTTNTWYNTGSISLAIPIGHWDVEWFADLYFNTTGTGGQSCYGTLSTANNSESDVDFTSRVVTVLDANAGTYWGFLDASRRKTITLASKTTYYFNIKTAHSPGNIGFDGGAIKTIVRAVCAYL